MAFEVEMRDGTLMLEFRGTFSADDLRIATDVVLQIEADMDVAPPRMTDLRAVTHLEIGFEEIMTLVLRRRASHVANMVRSAVVVGNEAQRGMARMFQTLNDHPRVLLHIFDDPDAALAWVRGPETTRAPS